MESINSIFAWLSEHESGFSALAALVVIVGVTLSPLGAGMRGLLSRRKSTASALPSTTMSTELSAAQDFLNTPPPLITDKPSIAVLPFVNMSKDEDKEFFADGMTEDIITGLSCDSRLFVIARNSSFAYKGQSPDIRTVGKELGVRYVLEGSIRPINERLRITVQLIETATGTHIWAEKIDRPVAEIFDIQDDVVDSLVATLCANVGVAEGQRVRRQPPENLKAWELCVHAEMTWIRARTPTAFAEAFALTQQATNADPEYGFAWALLAYLSSLKIPGLLSDNLVGDAENVMAQTSKAITLAPDDSAVLGYAGWAAITAGQAATGLNYLERSLAINPNSGLFRLAYANALRTNARTEEALIQLELFFRQSPKDPNIGRAYFAQSGVLTRLDRYAEAEQSARLCIKYLPDFMWGHLYHAIALSHLERHDEAQQAMQQFQKLAPHATLAKAEAWWALYYQENPAEAEKTNSNMRRVWAYL